jgi:hypothetical protein
MVVNNAVEGAMHQGFYPDIEFRKVDLFDVEGTTDLIKDVNPKAIFNCASVQSWWEAFTLGKEVFLKLRPSIIGGWIIMHTSTSYSLMKAVKEAGYYGKIPVVISTLPDIVAPALSKVGLEPTCGGGNVQLYIPTVKKIVSVEMNIPVTAIEVWMVGEHAEFGTPEEPLPFWIKIQANGEDITDEMGGVAGIRKRLQSDWIEYLLRGGKTNQQSTSAAFLANFINVLFDTKKFVGCVPGVKGLIGGYPVMLGRKVELALPKEISLAEAKRINEEAARKGDAVEEIKSDGRIVITDAASNALKEMFSWDYKEYTLEESVELAIDLNKRFRKLKATFQ